MKTTYFGSCHCGRVQFEIDADIDHVRVCDCSICRKRGALVHRVPESDVRIHTSLRNLTCYQWGSFTGRDYFCPVCGVLPFRRPSQPGSSEAAKGVTAFDGWAINTTCLAGFDASSLPKVEIQGSEIEILD